MAKKQSPKAPAAVTTTAVEERKIIMVPIKSIDLDPRNPRKVITESETEEMAKSISEHGVISAVALRPGKNGRFILVYGQRRLKASVQAGKDAIPAEVHDITAEVALDWMHVENLQRRDLTPVDEAASVALLAKHNNVQEICAKTGKSPKWVASRIKIAAMPESIQKLLANGEIGILQAEALALIDDVEVQEDLASRAEFMTADDIRKEVEKEMRKLEKALFDKGIEYKSGNGTLGPCATCPKRTGAQGDLFGDCEGNDRCLDAGCFEEKIHAFSELERERLKSEKKKLLAPNKKYELHQGIYAKSKAEIAAAKAAKVKPIYHVNDDGKVLEFYKKPKETEKKYAVSSWDIRKKKEELIKEAIIQTVGTDHRSKMEIIHFERLEDEITGKSINEMIDEVFDYQMEEESFDFDDLAKVFLKKDPIEFETKARSSLASLKPQKTRRKMLATRR